MADGELMHLQNLERWQHEHVFPDASQLANERRIWLVIGLTATMMVAEIAAGAVFGSMALLADGWHMGTHAGALGISALGYAYARRRARDPRFSFGTGKVGELAGFGSALVLALVALLIGYESMQRLYAPVAISFDEATAVAVLGLIVNLASALLLWDQPRAQAEGHHSHHARRYRDNNLRSAFLHVLADALTSLLAITALLTGRFLGWVWMDPLMALLGAVVIARWSYGLLRDTGEVLLDVQINPKLAADIRQAVEGEADNRVADLHVWRVGPGHFAAIVSLVTRNPRPPAHYKSLLRHRSELAHVTVEVHPCEGTSVVPSARAKAR